MNWFDVIIAVPLIWAIWRGFSHGLVQQLLAIVALIGGVWVSWRWGESTGTALGMNEQWATVGGFVVVFAAIVIALALVGKFTRGLFNIAGLGAFDTILGILFSMAKVWLIASVTLHWLSTLPITQSVLDQKVTAESALYAPLQQTAEWVFPYIDFAKEQIYNADHDPITETPLEQSL
ncbi:MAG: CvpA family protein [Rikenellaceae bacterium]|nr:CvpA family protein [Rikenellaceae bacterium]